MGLDTSHECWHGAYSAFMRWRTEVARLAGLPPIELMEGFYTSLKKTVIGGLPTLYCTGGNAWDCSNLQHLDERLPIKWESLKPDPLHELLNHSDCDGEIPWQSCAAIADRLEQLIPLMGEDAGGHIGNWKEKTKTFVDGLRLAASLQENVQFH